MSGRPMEIRNRVTQEFLGYVGTGVDDAVKVAGEDALIDLNWANKDGDLYLARGDYWLGEGSDNWADWAYYSWYCAIIYNPDHTISMKKDPTRKLYIDNWQGMQYLRWTVSGDDTNEAIVTFEFAPPK
jgi:hypothetical protein